MIPPLDLPNLNRQLEEWFEQIAEVAPTIADPERRQQLLQAMAQMREGQAIVNAEYQKTVHEVAARTAAVEQQNAETLAQLGALQSRAAAAAAAEPPAPPPPPAIDPARGRRLRDELVQRYRPVTPRVAAGADAGDVADIESGEFAPARRMPSEPPSPVQPTRLYTERDIEETPEVVIESLLKLASIEARDILYNLGCGDGRLLISAASQHGCRGVGIDSKAAVVDMARNNLRKARLTQFLTIDAGNPLVADVSLATVVFLSLGDRHNTEAGVTLLRQLRAGARIVTHQGGLHDWQPHEEKVVRDSAGNTYRLRLWRVPERAAGPASSIADLREKDWDSSSMGGSDWSSGPE